MIVADTQLMVYLQFPGPANELAMGVFVQDSAWASPVLWRSEFRNAVLGLIRNGRLSGDEALQGFERARLVVTGREHSVDTDSVLRLARGNRVTAYDLEFVALAESLGAPLVTFDREILEAFPLIARHPESFASG